LSRRGICPKRGALCSCLTSPSSPHELGLQSSAVNMGDCSEEEEETLTLRPPTKLQVVVSHKVRWGCAYLSARIRPPQCGQGVYGGDARCATTAGWRLPPDPDRCRSQKLRNSDLESDTNVPTMPQNSLFDGKGHSVWEEWEITLTLTLMLDQSLNAAAPSRLLPPPPPPVPSP